jgi:hypothetical protein
MKKLELVQMENLEGGKFWGSTGWYNLGGCDNGWQSVKKNYFALWIPVDTLHNEIPC